MSDRPKHLCTSASQAGRMCAVKIKFLPYRPHVRDSYIFDLYQNLCKDTYISLISLTFIHKTLYN